MDPIGPVAVNDIQALDHYISYYPNPSNNSISVEANAASKGDRYQLIFSNMEGKRLAKYSFAREKMSIDVSAYPSGTYVLELVNDAGQKLAGQLVNVKH